MAAHKPKACIALWHIPNKKIFHKDVGDDYHHYSKCGNLSSPERDANEIEDRPTKYFISKGYLPCKKCFTKEEFGE